MFRRPLAASSAVATALVLAGPIGADAVEPIRPGVVQESALDGDGVFEAALEAGQLARVRLTQVGVDVTMEVSGPDGTVLATADLARVRESQETCTWLVSASGPHRIVVRAARVPPGARVLLRLDSGPPTDAEKLLEAERRFGEGVRERDTPRAGFRERAVTAFADAAALWRQAGDHQAEARALIARGVTLNAIDPAAADRDCVAALALAQDLGDVAQETDALTCVAETAYALGAYDAAVEAQQNALAAARAWGNRFRESESLQNLAVFHAARSETALARDRYEEAIAQARETGDHEVLTIGLVSLGALLGDTGAHQQGYDLAREASEVHRAAGHQDRDVTVLGNMAASLFMLGDLDETEALAREGLALSRRLEIRASEVYMLARLSDIATERGDSKEAIARAREAQAVAARANLPREERVALDRLGLAHFKAGEVSQALEAVDASIAVSRRLGQPPTVRALLNLCRLHEAAGDLERAAVDCAEARRMTSVTSWQQYEPLASYLLARVVRRQGRPEEALRLVEDALERLEVGRRQVRRVDWREAFVASHREIDEFHVDLLVEAAVRDGGPRAAADAFDAAERARTRALRDALIQSRLGAREGIDERLAARERELRRLIAREVEIQLRRPGAGLPLPKAGRLEGLERELRELEGEIRRLGPRYADLDSSSRLGVRELQARVLDEDTVVLAFALGASRSALWVVTRVTLEMHLLPGRARIEELARAAYGSFSRPRSPREPASRELARLIVPPAQPRLRKRVVVIADGVLHYLPLAALPDPRGGALVDRHEIVVLPSLSTVGLLRAAAPPSSHARAVAVLADPVFRADDARIAEGARAAASPVRVASDASRAAEDFAGLDQLPRLVFTRREAARIASLAGEPARSLVALDFDATLRTVREGRLRDYRFVHFATHGFLNTRRPELSGLVLTLFDAEGRAQDGFLSSLDAFNLDLSAEVVVLSACRTALGKEVKGEGLVGLPQAFLYAGARRVVSSLWAVDDAATAALMGRFYEGLLARSPVRPAAALRDAQAYVRAQPQWRHPYYWAGFQLLGDWN